MRRKEQVTTEQGHVKDFVKWSLTYTKKIVSIATLVWIAQVIYNMVIISYAVIMFGNFSYLDSFITDNGETFRLIVGANIVSKTFENIFKYNDGGIFGTSNTTSQKDSDINIEEITLGSEDNEPQG